MITDLIIRFLETFNLAHFFYRELLKLFASVEVIKQYKHAYAHWNTCGIPHGTRGDWADRYYTDSIYRRLNLTLRESIATLSRRTWSIAHSRESLRWSLEWGRAYYHFVRPHHSLTLRHPSGRICQRRTPAMAAGLTRKIWAVQDLLCLPLLPN
jgi:hypothetical protein